MTDFRADLHCHSTCSDGSLHPRELVELAVKNKLKGLAITDHDCLEAFSLAQGRASELGLRLVTGVEFSCQHGEHNIHVLAYGFHPDDSGLNALCQLHLERRLERKERILKALSHLGIDISDGDLGERTLWGRPHIAGALVRKGLVPDVSSAFHKYLGEGKAAYVPSDLPSVKETIELIHKARAFAVFAHPHLCPKRSVVRSVLTLPFDGIEAYYAIMHPSRERRWLDVAKSRGLMVTGGSDFHGDAKPMIGLGASWVGEDVFSLLERRMDENC